MAPVLVVADAWDGLAGAFTEFARRRGVACELVDLATAATRVTITLPEGLDCIVMPQVSWFLRTTGWVQEDAPDEESRFHWYERFAVVWAAAALSDLAVNRPSDWGWWGRLSGSACVTETRVDSRVRTAEIFSYGLPPARDLYHLDVLSGALVPSGDEAVPFPLRSRRLPPCRGWDQVIVVGHRGFRVTTVDLSPYDLEADSVTMAASLGLSFATVSWAIPADGGVPILARVSAFPTLAEVTPVWSDTREALVELLVADRVS